MGFHSRTKREGVELGSGFGCCMVKPCAQCVPLGRLSPNTIANTHAFPGQDDVVMCSDLGIDVFCNVARVMF
jgi:hypothetical protein